jgi:hypothetical protein
LPPLIRAEIIIVEQVHSFPAQGVASAFAFGQFFGFAQALALTAGGDKVRFVSPQQWVGNYGLLRQPKKRRLTEALQIITDFGRFPALSGIIDAALIAHSVMAETHRTARGNRGGDSRGY